MTAILRIVYFDVMLWGILILNTIKILIKKDPKFKVDD